MTRRDEMAAQFEAFHRDQPNTWRLFKRFAFEMVERGFRNCSARGIFQRIRWETDTPDVEGRSTFKVNNNYSPFCARLFHKRYPSYDGFFRTRLQISKLGPATGMRELGPEDFDG